MEKLHPFHVSIMIYMNQSGVIALILPRLFASNYGYNGWLSLAFFFAVSILNIYLISLVYHYGQGRSIFEILEASLPKFFLFPLYVLLAALWTLIGCFAAKQFVFIFQMLDFPTTHPMLLKLLLDILAFSLVIKGIYSISKATTVFFWLFVWMHLLVIYFFGEFQWVRLTSFVFQGETDFVQGGFDIYSAFLGLEIALLLLPYAEKNKKLTRAVYIGNLMSVLAYLVVSVISFGVYSLEQLKRQQYPVLDLLSYIKLPFIERMENLLFAFILFPVLVSVVLYTWASVLALKRIAPKADTNWLAFAALAFSFGAAWVPDVISEVEMLLKYFSYAEEGIAFGLPLLLIIVLLFQRKGHTHA
ncbi:hypothetical protein SD71_17755 [Cohnella kolymensis]|uniref:Uncharacterized protein n=1 Tax=Cohnella kolymensis TaxID=1590652 RepID=A0ABR5A1A8_9BACL|nr:GerAB/ArcD/ProY family transporter [Cohnella kolymensis]KIL34847.1 hypothetical protein SD71_17755 [Cohnella kolymensis]